VPPPVLRHLQSTLQIPTPDLTSLRALYQRRSTLHEHQAWAPQLLDFRPLTERRQRALLRHVRHEALKAFTLNHVVEFAKRWLYERRMLIPTDRRVRALARTAYRDTEQGLLEAVRREIPADVLQTWHDALFAPRQGQTSTLEWLQQAPRRKFKGLKEQLDKIHFLKALHVDAYSLAALRLERQRAYARRMHRRRPARFRALKDPGRTLEMVCFLRITFLQTTDVAVSLADLLIVSLHARTLGEVREAQARVARTFQPMLRDIRRLLTDPTIADAALRPALLALMPAEHDLFPSRAAGVRWQLHEKARHVRPLLKALLTLPLAGDEQAPLVRACAQLRDLYQRQVRALPVPCESSFAPRWTALVDQPDRQRALRAFEAAPSSRCARRSAMARCGLSIAWPFASGRRCSSQRPSGLPIIVASTRNSVSPSTPRTPPPSCSPRWKRGWCPWPKRWTPGSCVSMTADSI